MQFPKVIDAISPSTCDAPDTPVPPKPATSSPTKRERPAGLTSSQDAVSGSSRSQLRIEAPGSSGTARVRSKSLAGREVEPIELKSDVRSRSLRESFQTPQQFHEVAFGQAEVLVGDAEKQLRQIAGDRELEVASIAESVAGDNVDHPERLAQSNTGRSIARALHAYVQDIESFRGGPLSMADRKQAVLDFAARVLRNDVRNPYGKWALNLALPTIRTGLIVFTATSVRQELGYWIGRGMADMGPQARTFLGLLPAIVSLAQNATGWARDETTGRGTEESRQARLNMMANTACIALAFASMRYSGGAVVADALSANILQTAAYCLLRDALQIPVTVQDNSRPDQAALNTHAGLYGAIQAALSQLMDITSPSSGAGLGASEWRAAHSPIATTSTLAGLASVLPDHVAADIAEFSTRTSITGANEAAYQGVAMMERWQNNVRRAGENAMGEVFDDVSRPIIANAVEGRLRDTRIGLRLAVGDGQSARRLEDVALTTNPARIGYFQNLISVYGLADAVLTNMRVPNELKALLCNSLVGFEAWREYGNFINMHNRNPPQAQPEATIASPATENIPTTGSQRTVPSHISDQVGLRQRRLHSDT